MWQADYGVATDVAERESDIRALLDLMPRPRVRAVDALAALLEAVRSSGGADGAPLAPQLDEVDRTGELRPQLQAAIHEAIARALPAAGSGRAFFGAFKTSADREQLKAAAEGAAAAKAK